MAPGPYQSSVFRFVIGQYRQGRDRHRRAVQRTRQTAALGIKIGAAATVFPFYTAMQVSQGVGRRLRASVSSRRLRRLGPTVSKLLDFSGFDEAFSDVDGREAIAPAHRQSIDTSTQAMLRTLIAVGVTLTSKQIKQLSAEQPVNTTHDEKKLTNSSPTVSSSAISFVRDRWVSIRKRFAITTSATRFDTTIDTSSSVTCNQSAITTANRITGVASDIKTHALVLILGYKTPWQSLSDSQRTELQAKIESFLNAYPVQAEEREWSTALNIEPCCMSALAVYSRLPSALSYSSSSPIQVLRSARSLWTDVLRLVTWLYEHRGQGAIKALPDRLDTVLQQLPLSDERMPHQLAFASPYDALVPALPSVTALSQPRTKLPKLKTQTSSIAIAKDAKPVSRPTDLKAWSTSKPATEQPKVLNESYAHYWDTEVVSYDYIEHPLERVLKWVDRLLSWVEKKWQTIRNYLTSQIRSPEKESD